MALTVQDTGNVAGALERACRHIEVLDAENERLNGLLQERDEEVKRLRIDLAAARKQQEAQE